MTPRSSASAQLGWLIALVLVSVFMSTSRAQRRTPPVVPDVPYKDFDIVQSQMDANGLPLNPRWGRQVVAPGTLPTPADSCPLGDEDTSHWTSSPQFPHCTSIPVSFNGETFGQICGGGHHVNFRRITYEGTAEWAGTGDRPFDDDYTFDVRRDDDALYSAADYDQRIHVEFDARETVDQWDNTNTWWDRFRHENGKEKSDAERYRLIHGRPVKVIGMLNLDTSHRGKPELHPAYAMFVNTDQTWHSRTHTWAFFVRNWGNEGYCGGNQVPWLAHVINVQVRDAASIVAVSGSMGARNASSAEVKSSMQFISQPNQAGVLLSFVLLPAEKQSWFVGDITFERPLVTLEPEFPPPFDALTKRIDGLSRSAREQLLARQQSVVLRHEGVPLVLRRIVEPTDAGETRLTSPQEVDPQSDAVRTEKDTIGELNQRKQFEIIRWFFAQRGVQVDLPRER